MFPLRTSVEVDEISSVVIGLIVAKKSLQKGCSVSPDDCACRKEGKDPADCDQ